MTQPPSPVVGVVSGSWSEARGPSPAPTTLHVETNSLPPYTFTGKPLIVGIVAMTPALYTPPQEEEIPDEDIPPDEEPEEPAPDPIPCFLERYTHVVTKDTLYVVDGRIVSPRRLIPVGATSVRISVVADNPTYAVGAGILTYPTISSGDNEVCSFDTLRTKDPENGPFNALSGAPLAEPVWTWTVTPCALYYEVIFGPSSQSIDTYADATASAEITLEWFCGVQVTPTGYLPAPDGPVFIATRQWSQDDMQFAGVAVLDTLVDSLGRIELPDEISPLIPRVLKFTVSSHTNGDPSVAHSVYMYTTVTWWVGDLIVATEFHGLNPLFTYDGFTITDTPATHLWSVPSGATHFSLGMQSQAAELSDYYDTTVEIFLQPPVPITEPTPELNVLYPDQITSFRATTADGSTVLWAQIQTSYFFLFFNDPVSAFDQTLMDTFKAQVAASGIRFELDLLIGPSEVPIARSGVVVCAVLDFNYSTWRGGNIHGNTYETVTGGVLNTAFPYFFPYDYQLQMPISFENAVGLSLVAAQGESNMSWAAAPDPTPPTWYDLISVAAEGNSAGIGMLLPTALPPSETSMPFQVVNMPTGLALHVELLIFTGSRGRSFVTFID